LNPTQTENATRAKSLFNALLCLSFNNLRFIRTKINSTLTHKQKPRPKKLIRLIDLKNNFEFRLFKPKTQDKISD
ncbi:hypothetical protein, partial [Vibrio cidicii]|uniref:hypothetical protein n=1 Tax=Vibrio cidicii TaxID=1763883 RepID=UPI0037038C7A